MFNYLVRKQQKVDIFVIEDSNQGVNSEDRII